MFKDALVEHQQRRTERKRRVDQLKKDAVASAQRFSSELVEDVNKEVFEVFSNQREIDESLKTIQSAIRMFLLFQIKHTIYLCSPFNFQFNPMQYYVFKRLRVCDCVCVCV
eukprot:m.21390 g.21390  ORF g.21390 m.21390 type:complete len:111 (+) comp8719_c0_seq3:144-476(+)